MPIILTTHVFCNHITEIQSLQRYSLYRGAGTQSGWYTVTLWSLGKGNSRPKSGFAVNWGFTAYYTVYKVDNPASIKDSRLNSIHPTVDYTSYEPVEDSSLRSK